MASFHTIIIGGGPGGTRAAETLALAGKSVALVSNDLGGECLNYGCIPTKTYLWTAELFEHLAEAEVFGIHISPPSLNWQRMKTRRAEIVAKLKKNLRFRVEKSGVTIIDGIATFEDAHTIKVDNEQKLSAENVIIATGSGAVFPPGFTQNSKIMGNREILELDAIPKTLLIIGGGAVGVEFASLFSALGTKVTIAEMTERLLPNEDEEISAELERVFKRKNIAIQTNTRISPEQTEAFEKVLVAVGRKPETASLGLEKIGVVCEKNAVKTNDFLQTNVPHIFAIGDVAGKALLAYTAEREAEIAANFLLGKRPEPLRYETVPNAIFSLPEVASVGITEGEAQKRSQPYIAAKSLFSANAKALIIDQRDGFVKIIADKNSRKILGVHMIGPKVSELIGESSLALTAQLTLDVFAKNIRIHPVLAEIVKDAC